ncbi:LPXTG cell wall anchor domain-containing protein [Geodermatophilus maliterrae]|uniref:LPXTG cell wall anchor domain-containing protein n=1 Tax=Geodermatophilus maliterrae TaxID=3162531 RepID=A0ABV3XA86_9ACTN
MSTHTLSRHHHRWGTARVGVVGLAVMASMGLAMPSAGAAPAVALPLEPGEVLLSAFPVENAGAMDAMGEPTGAGPTEVAVQYGDTLTVQLPSYLDTTDVVVMLGRDDDGNGSDETTYSSEPGAPTPLGVTGEGTSSIAITLPNNAPVDGALGTLTLEGLTTTTALGPEYTSDGVVEYLLELNTEALADETLEPEVLALSSEPCDLTSATPCPVTATAGTVVTLDLTAGSALRDLGLTDLTGVEVALQALDATGNPVGAPVALTVQVTGSTATFEIPAGTAAGSYGLLIGQPTPTGVSLVLADLVVAAPAAAPVAAPPATAAPSTQAVAGNVGLRSNTGVTAPATGSSTGTVAAGAGLLLLAGAGGLAVARTRRRPAVETGTDEV